jgi:hypothetical protein
MTMPAGAATKFHPDGRVKPFPGNTFVAALDPARPESAAVAEVVRRLAAGAVGSRLTFLPRASYHMTVFEGVSLAVADPACWPADLAPTGDLAAATAFIEARLDGVAGLAAPLRMVPAGLVSWPDGIAIGLEPADAAENARLRGFRDRLAAATGLRKPDHDRYPFHLTLTYWLDRVDDADWAMERDGLSALLRRDIPSLALPAPDFCTFADMHAFPPRRSMAA